MTKASGFAVALVAIGVLAVVTVSADAQTGSVADPIVVTGVRIGSPVGFGDGTSARPGNIDVVFKNTSTVVATEVVFDVTDSHGKLIEGLDASGTFSPGVSIDHTFPNQSYATDLTVTLERATFADGRVWIHDAGKYLPNFFSP